VFKWASFSCYRNAKVGSKIFVISSPGVAKLLSHVTASGTARIPMAVGDLKLHVGQAVNTIYVI
jgi:hypothetical protein